MLPWTGTTGACAGGLQVISLPLVHGLSQCCDECGQGECRLGLASLTHVQGNAK